MAFPKKNFKNTPATVPAKAPAAVVAAAPAPVAERSELKGLGKPKTPATLRSFTQDDIADALIRAKKRGVILGNPRLREGATAAGIARKRDARQTARKIAPYIAQARKAGCTTLAELAEALTARGIRTPRGRFTWNAEQVRRIIARTEDRRST